MQFSPGLRSSQSPEVKPRECYVESEAAEVARGLTSGLGGIITSGLLSDQVQLFDLACRERTVVDVYIIDLTAEIQRLKLMFADI